MNGLVGYGSSDDEEDASYRSTTAHHQHGQDAISVIDRQEVSQTSPSIEAGTGSDGPLLGPSMPSTFASAESYEQDTIDMLPTLPERDMLRFLTQPSHPATSLPSEPDTDADPAVTVKFKRFLDLKSKGIHFNEGLATKSSFKNPNLFATLLERASLPSRSQYAFSLPLQEINIDSLPDWAFKEELANSQKALTAQLTEKKKAESAAGKRSIDFMPASTSEELHPSSAASVHKRKRA